jgi:signal transduction histidine kinase
MHERAASIGGLLTINSYPETGTTVRLVVKQFAVG